MSKPDYKKALRKACKLAERIKICPTNKLGKRIGCYHYTYKKCIKCWEQYFLKVVK